MPVLPDLLRSSVSWPWAGERVKNQVNIKLKPVKTENKNKHMSKSKYESQIKSYWANSKSEKS